MTTLCLMLIIGLGASIVGFVAALFCARTVIRMHDRDAPDVPRF